MHRVGKLAEAKTATTAPYDRHSDRFRRFLLVDRTAGSVHQELAVCELDSGGHVDLHVHAFEQGLYVLDGQVELNVAEEVETVARDDYVFIDVGATHAFRNPSDDTVRWLEVSAPQPGGSLADTAFPESELAAATSEAPYRRGRFEESQLPPASDTIGLAGFGAANVGGASLKMMIERDFGASQFNLFVVQYVPDGHIAEHDHPFEEAFFFLSGEIEAVLDGKTYTLRAGDYCWSAVRSMHTFTNRSDEPVRWIETQVPQPPPRHQARFKGEWERLIGG